MDSEEEFTDADTDDEEAGSAPANDEAGGGVAADDQVACSEAVDDTADGDPCDETGAEYSNWSEFDDEWGDTEDGEHSNWSDFSDEWVGLVYFSLKRMQFAVGQLFV